MLERQVRQNKTTKKGCRRTESESLDWASLKEKLDFLYPLSNLAPSRGNPGSPPLPGEWFDLTACGFRNSEELLRTESEVLCWSQRDYGKIFPLNSDLLPEELQKGLQPGVGDRYFLLEKGNLPKSVDLQQGFLTRGSVNLNENNNLFSFLLSSES